MPEYLIDPEIVKKEIEIPLLIAKLSYLDKAAAIKYIRHYGEVTMPVTPLYEELIQLLSSFGGEEAVVN